MIPRRYRTIWAVFWLIITAIWLSFTPDDAELWRWIVAWLVLGMSSGMLVWNIVEAMDPRNRRKW